MCVCGGEEGDGGQGRLYLEAPGRSYALGLFAPCIPIRVQLPLGPALRVSCPRTVSGVVGSHIETQTLMSMSPSGA